MSVLDNARIICADWGKEPKKRAAYEVLVSARLIRRVTTDVRDVTKLLRYAGQLEEATLVTFDAPIGVPESFIAFANTKAKVAGFVDWLLTAPLAQCKSAQEWSVTAPFFQVPGGSGALGLFEGAARRHKVELKRRIEQATGGKSVFITAGVPGSVGSAARDIWRGLVDARKAIPYRLWPFDGALEKLLAPGNPVVAEIYPRAAYATALVDHGPRSRLFVAKTDAGTRSRAVERLLATDWSKAHKVVFKDLEPARANEDEFDALMTAAALLRCVTDKLPLWASAFHDPRVEGAILGTGSIDLTLPEVDFGKLFGVAQTETRASHVPEDQTQAVPVVGTYKEVVGKALLCPECRVHKFTTWPSGWDSHAKHNCTIAGATPAIRQAAFRRKYATLFKR